MCKRTYSGFLGFINAPSKVQGGCLKHYVTCSPSWQNPIQGVKYGSCISKKLESKLILLPVVDVRQRKAMRISKNQHIIPIPSVQEQMGSVTGQQISTVIGQVTGILPQQLTAANFRNLQPASSSSHGSLTSLKPIR